MFLLYDLYQAYRSKLLRGLKLNPDGHHQKYVLKNKDMLIWQNMPI